ncbi:MAG: hypothetical protein FK733_16120 [Asgard group archaeon]|nr:hypothetical protein [Asgard group archaeon]
MNSRKWVKAAQKTEKETKKYSKVLYNTWDRIIKNFEMDFKFFNELNEEKIPDYEKTLTYMEMLAFTKKLANIQNLVTWGFYHSALIKLRFMLDTTILAYYLDQQLPNTDQSEKIKLMRKHKGELWGTRLRRRTYMYEKDFGEEVEKIITSINESIDEYMVDRSAADWKEKNMPFSIKDFSECVHHTKNATSLIIKHFTKALEDFTYNGELFITHKDEEQTETLQLEDQFNKQETEETTEEVVEEISEEVTEEVSDETIESDEIIEEEN